MKYLSINKWTQAEFIRFMIHSTHFPKLQFSHKHLLSRLKLIKAKLLQNPDKELFVILKHRIKVWI
jgi:hypothetical protein